MHYLFFDLFPKAVQKLFQLHLKLKKLGDTTYLSVGTIPCSTHGDEVDARVKKIQGDVIKWAQRVAELRDQYPWLLYFSIPRILRLYQLICSNEVDKIIHDVSFLTDNKPADRKRLKKTIKVSSNINDCMKIPLFLLL